MGMAGSEPPYSGSDSRKRRLEPNSRRWGHRRRVDRGREAKRRKRWQGDETRRWAYSTLDLSAFKDRFRIVSYNILGVENAAKHRELYNQVDPRYLSWDRRKKQICEELRHYNAGIICFQEVDRFNDLENLLQKYGYIGVYKGRTGEASDGCAIFWKEAEFSLLHQESIEFQKSGLRNNVAQLCLFKVLPDCSISSLSGDSESELAGPTPSRTLLVGNIHVLFNPNRGDIKLGQIRLLLERVQAMQQRNGNSPVVISGDLNSMPKSAIYQFLSSSELDFLAYDRKKISGQIEYPLNQIPFAQIDASRSYPIVKPKLMMYRWSKEEICLAAGSTGCTHLKNPLKLSSAYKGVPGNHQTRDNDGEPLATSFHSKFLGTVDYIWHSSALVPVGVVEMLSINELRKLGGLPSERWGSDHFSLVCELAFLENERR